MDGDYGKEGTGFFLAAQYCSGPKKRTQGWEEEPQSREAVHLSQYTLG